jgi:hypothetical protein
LRNLGGNIRIQLTDGGKSFSGHWSHWDSRWEPFVCQPSPPKVEILIDSHLSRNKSGTYSGQVVSLIDLFVPEPLRSSLGIVG